MAFTEEKLKLVLVKNKLLTASQFNEFSKKSNKDNKSVYELLLEEKILDDVKVGEAFSQHYDVSFIDLTKTKVDPVYLKTIPKVVCEKQGVIVYGKNEDGFLLGMLDPLDISVRNLIEKKLGQPVQVGVITPHGLNLALENYSVDVEDRLREALHKLENKSLSQTKKDDLVVEAVNLLLQYGYKSKASDIHIEPFRESVLVRFRIDGIMHDILEVSTDLLDVIVTRIKIMSRLRTDEHYSAQDGKLQFQVTGETVDVRVSIVPVTAGENIVMRILSSKSRDFNLEVLGFLEKDLELVMHAIKNPHGMILVTGPTGSGKTTTLYAVLKILNKRDVHISTIEDPVEFDIDGISQIQVNPKTNLTFAKGLRALVRQDPDIIMVGEIRDKETAGIAVNSAMTGHLVLSTLHANNAPTSLPRMLDMGVEPFLVASTVNIVIAQRLVRKLCQACKSERKITKEELKTVDTEEALKKAIKKHTKGAISSLKFYHGAGCSECGGTGYTGRLGIFEVLDMTDNIKELILKRKPSDEIMKLAQKNGMTTMLEDGITKVFNGLTTFSEVLRVTRE